MDGYYRFHRNRNCSCMRCRIGSAMGPAVLITLGVLFLLETQGMVRFHHTWPILLIVIGVVKILAYSASTEGHQPPFWQQGVVAPPPSGPQVTPPPPPPPASYNPAGSAPGNEGQRNG